MLRKYLQQLTASQKKAVLHLEGPLLVIAGPGSGKTRVITYRIAALIDSGIHPHNICAITFTNKAAEQMRQRVTKLGIPYGSYIGTFHSLCVRILRRYHSQAELNSNFSIYDTYAQGKCIKQAVKDCDLDTKNFPPARMLEAVSSLKNNLIDADSFKNNADDFISKNLSRIYLHYQKLLGEHNGLDFDDLLMKTAFLLRDNPDIRSELSRRFRFLLIDEYQDTNHAQYRIAADIVSAHNNICATGDPDQSIYRWRGADIGNILNFEKDFPDAIIVKLQENFRSTANILQAADNLIAANEKRKQKKLIATKSAGTEVAINAYEDELEEAKAVAERVKHLISQGTAARQIAVFYRINAMSRPLEEAFMRNKIPYRIVKGLEFYNRKEIRDLLAYLKIIVNPQDETSLLRIINTPTRGIGKTTLGKIRSYCHSNGISFYSALEKAGRIASLSERAKRKIADFVKMTNSFKNDVDKKTALLMKRVLSESGMDASLQSTRLDDRCALDNVSELINGAAGYDSQTEDVSLLDYLQQISLFSDTDAYDPSSDNVAMMTLHSAKGLEFENVFIVGLEEGILPHERNLDNQDQLEEERRLFFVGITRAKSRLHISCCRYRTIRGQQLRVIASGFLSELGCDLGEPDDETCGQTETSLSVAPFRPGQVVRHTKFGCGTVKQFTDIGQNSTIVVKFNTGQTKTLMLKYAGLKNISNQG